MRTNLGINSETFEKSGGCTERIKLGVSDLLSLLSTSNKLSLNRGKKEVLNNFGSSLRGKSKRNIFVLATLSSELCSNL